MNLDRRAFTVTGLGWLLVSPVHAEQTLRIAGVEQHFDSYVAELVLVEVFRRAGLRMETVRLPNARASLEVSEGRLDGEIARIKAYGDAYPTLIRVEPSYYTWTVKAFYRKNSGIAIASAADLKRYTLGYVRGAKLMDALVEGAPQVSTVTGTGQLIEMLHAGRFAVAIEGAQEARYHLQKLGFTDEIASVDLVMVPMFLYLHARHKDLVPVLGKTLRSMLASGEFQKLFAAAEQELAKRKVF